MVHRLILEYQHHLTKSASYQATSVGSQESHLAHVSKQLSLWANEIALDTEISLKRILKYRLQPGNMLT
eukprot:7126394-Ditylum_brightwellii.AAC.1